MYEKVKFLKLTFKFWNEERSADWIMRHQVTTDRIHVATRTPEWRHSCNPDCQNRTMDASNIQMRKNSKHLVGGQLSRPWYLRMRPTFNNKNYGGIVTACNPWFQTADIFHNKSVPVVRNAYLFDYLAPYTMAHLVYQITITLAFKGVQNCSKYKTNMDDDIMNPFSTNRMIEELSLMSYEDEHPIMRDFDSSEGFDVHDFGQCPLEQMNA
ncbi:hypothetical protein LSAT2_026173 [Lamellibrachia satsuma]|nr:hypothetical protein LSAT2_026173 [Lamellibrachia satsuma]